MAEVKPFSPTFALAHITNLHSNFVATSYRAIPTHILLFLFLSFSLQLKYSPYFHYLQLYCILYESGFTETCCLTPINRNLNHFDHHLVSTSSFSSFNLPTIFFSYTTSSFKDYHISVSKIAFLLC